MKKEPVIFLQRLMVFSTITSFVLTFMLVLNAFFSVGKNVENDYINWFSYFMIIFSGLLFMLALQLFVNEKTKIGAHFRFLFFYTIILLVSCYFFGALNAPVLLIPVCIVQYILEANINNMFVFHDRFTQDYQNKQGKELVEYLFHNSFSASDFAEKINKTHSALFIIGFLEFFLFLIPSVLNIHLSAFTYIAALVFFVSLIVILIMIGLFGKESYFAFLGFTDLIKHERKYFQTVLSVLVCGVLLAVVFASGKPLVSIPKIEHKITEQKKVYDEKVEIPELEEIIPRDFIYIDIPPVKKSPFLDIVMVILRILKYLIIIALVVVVIVFIFSPFFSKDWKRFFQEHRLSKYIKKVFADFKDFIFAVLNLKKAENSYSTIEGKEFREAIQSFYKHTKKSNDKKNELDRLTKHFLIFITWGVKHSIVYTKNLAPAEYAFLIKQYFLQTEQTSLMEAAETVGKLFEKSLYDKELLTKQQEKEYVEAVKMITEIND